MKIWFKEQINFNFKKVFGNLNVRLVLYALLFYVLAVLILGVNFLPQELDLKEDQVSPRDVFARQGMVYESEVLTEAAREEAAQNVNPTYRMDSAILANLELNVKDFFGQLRLIQREEDLDRETRLFLFSELKVDLPEGNLAALAEAEPETIDLLEKRTLELLRGVYSKGVQERDLEEIKAKLLDEVNGIEDVPAKLIPVVGLVLDELEYKPNFFLDPALTAQERQAARDAVAPIQVRVRQDEKIVGIGDVVTAADIEAMQKLGLLRSTSSYNNVVGLSLLVAISFVLLLFFLNQYNKQLLVRESHFILLGLLLILGFALIRGVNAINIGGTSEVAQLVGYLTPLAAITMLITILFGARLAFFVGMILAVFTGFASSNQLQFAVVAFVSSIIGIYSVSRLSQRSDLAKASLYIMLANIMTVLALGLVLDYSFTMFSVALPMGIFNGVLSSVLTIVSLPFFETAFSITTTISLLELSNPNQPILKKLLMEAPGTYHHSILVGNLAEAAADAVKADSLLARVGAYYHDIGKLKRPYFFVENQLSAENPHDKLTPTLSTLIILAHIKDGLELAKEQRLPQVVKDFIGQHHGTSLVSFFHTKALNQANNDRDAVREADFRYEGPKPQTKETAILMLADSVEAAVRSLSKSNPSKIEMMVKKVIKDKLNDGQLDECDLTFKELDTIAQSFIKVLSGFFHARIEYPEQMLKEAERRHKDVNQHKQPAG